MKKILLKKVPREINKTQKNEVMAIWGSNTYINKSPKKKINIINASTLKNK